MKLDRRKSERCTLLAATVVVAIASHSAAQTPLAVLPVNHVLDYEIVVGDLDGDGFRDFGFERYLGPTSSSKQLDFYSTATGVLLHQWAAQPQDAYLQVMPIGDVNGDGRDDVAHLEYSNIGPNGVAYTVVRSGLTGAYIHQLLFNAFGTYYVVGVGDLNGNGTDDLLLGQYAASVNGMMNAGHVDLVDGLSLQVLRSHSGTYAGQELSCWRLLGDLDGDGERDYLLGGNGPWIGISTRTGAQLFSVPRLSYTYGSYMTDVGDVNGDGFDDIAFVDAGTPPPYLYQQKFVFAGPSATQLLWTHYSSIFAPAPEHYGRFFGRLGDLDGDGFADFGLEGGPIGGTVSATIFSGRTQSILFAEGSFGTVPMGIHPMDGSPGDVDGDGFPDFFAATEPQPGVYEIWVVPGTPPGVSHLGVGCSGPHGTTPRIGVGIGARLGRTMTVSLSQASPNLLAAVLVAGVSDQQWNGMPLPLDLGFLGLPGCAWRTSADASLLIATANTNGQTRQATFDLTIPQATSLLGAAVFWQWFVQEPSGAGLAGSVTAALRTTVVQ